MDSVLLVSSQSRVSQRNHCQTAPLCYWLDFLQMLRWIHAVDCSAADMQPTWQMSHPGHDVAYFTSSSLSSIPEALLIQVAHLQFSSRLCRLLPLSACFFSANVGSYKQSELPSHLLNLWPCYSSTSRHLFYASVYHESVFFGWWNIENRRGSGPRGPFILAVCMKTR